MRRIAILNRGEAAVRFIRALDEYNLERGESLQSVAFYTEPDADTPFVQLADVVVHLGPAMRTNAAGATVNAYGDHDHVIALLRQHDCDAVWPGWGFVSEDPDFVERLEAEQITFLGPSSEAMRKLGDKIASKQLAEIFGVPVSPWAIVGDQSHDELRAMAAQIGYPLMVKASAGGGGRGIRKVEAADQLIGAIDAARAEVAKYFASGGLFMEACIDNARHIEVQLAVDHEGLGHAVGVRDCSIQRRNQKVIEEAPSPVLNPEDEAFICEASKRLAEGTGYRGVGTAEFLYRPADRRFFFLEVNSRLQVEHTITELTTGTDLVKGQIDIARGIAWKPNGPSRGHAIEVRLNAEDPDRGFQPSPGLLRVFEPPAGPGIRIDSGVRAGVSIAPEFDSMVAKVMAYGATRQEAIARLIRALRNFPVVVEDGTTNKAFLIRLLQAQEFVEATADTRWLDGAMNSDALRGGARKLDAALAAAIIAHRRGVLAEIQRFFAEVQAGIPQRLRPPSATSVKLSVQGEAVQIDVHEVGPARYDARIGEDVYRVQFEQQDLHHAIMQRDEQRRDVLFGMGRSGIYVEVDAEGYVIEERSGGVVRAPSPAMVVSVAVEEGDVVAPGDRLATLEAMKMEIPLYAQEAGRIVAVRCQANQQVAAGQIIMSLRPEGESTAEGEGLAVRLGEAPGVQPLDLLRDGTGWDISRIDALSERDATSVVQALIEAIDAILLGYDAPEALTRDIIRLFEDDTRLTQLQHPERLTPLAEALATFTDADALFERGVLPGPEGRTATSAEAAFYEFCRNHHGGEEEVSPELAPRLLDALRHYGVTRLEPSERMRAALWRLAVAHAHTAPRQRVTSALLRALIDLRAAGARFEAREALPARLEQIIKLADRRFPFVADNARQASYELFQRERFVRRQRQLEADLDDALVRLRDAQTDPDERVSLLRRVAAARHSMMPLLVPRCRSTQPGVELALSLFLRRVYERFEQDEVSTLATPTGAEARASLSERGDLSEVLALTCALPELHGALKGALERLPAHSRVALELLCDTEPQEADLSALSEALLAASMRSALTRVTLTWDHTDAYHAHHITWTRHGEQRLLTRTPLLRDIHPEAARRLELWRLAEFELTRLPSDERIFAFLGRARSNPADERVFVLAEVQSVPHQDASESSDGYLMEFEHAYFEALRVLRDEQARRPSRRRHEWNHLGFYLRQPVRLDRQQFLELAGPLAPYARGLGIQEITIRAKLLDATDVTREVAIVVGNPSRQQLEVDLQAPDKHPIPALTRYELRVIQARRMGLVYPYEVARLLQGESLQAAPPHLDMMRGAFVEYDLDANDVTRLVPVQRAPGNNTCTVVIGVVTHTTARHPDGMTRVFIASDPTMAMGALSEPECRRIIAALDLADQLGVPVEWLPVSSGAKIAMDSGTENLDWTAQVLRRIIQFTQAGGEINLLVHGVNVGAQSYWNAEATMLQHTRGVLIMTPQASMVLTGKKALEYSGSVAAEDERGIGGVDRIMGPNGQSQYLAESLGDAYRILFEHYRYTYRRRQDRRVAPFHTSDSPTRSILAEPYLGSEPFNTIGEIFSDATNPGRKKPFAIREVMRAVIDRDSDALERFAHMADADTAVIWDAHLGGHAACVIGFESRPIQRRGMIPIDGPDTWTGGTLFPQSSRKVARAINGASGNRPVVVLANLSGFDGSPESMRRLQLEHGAEIGRAVVNFDGPLVFVVVGRYHGGAYVVFSKALNPNLTSLALEGAYASVIGGAPAAAVVFPREVRARAQADARVIEATALLKDAPASQRPKLREQLDAITERVILEKQGEVALAFDNIHTVHRATAVGSLDGVIAADQLRPAIISVLDRAQGQ